MRGIHWSRLLPNVQAGRAAAAPGADPVSASRHVQDEAGASRRRHEDDPAHKGRLGGGRFFSIFKAGWKNRKVTRNSPPAPPAASLPGANPQVPQPATMSGQQLNKGHNRILRVDLGKELASISISLNTIRNTDWERLQQDIEEAVGGDSLSGMRSALYSAALRGFALSAKSVVRIARSHPEELGKGAFRRLYGIACGIGDAPGGSVADLRGSEDLPQAIDPAFNPGRFLSDQYNARSDQINAQHEATVHPSACGDSGASPHALADDERAISKMGADSLKWICIHDTRLALQAGLEKILLLHEAYDAYVASRGVAQGDATGSL
jgi:hypothetical protein